MCGRFTLHASPEAVRRAFQLELVPDFKQRFNIAPTQHIPAIVRKSSEANKQLQFMHWGLIPSWAKDPKIGARMINARSETVLEKPSFRTPFRRRRCLIPSDGFFEWQVVEDGKQPIYVRKKDGSVFAFAGLWDHWEKSENSITSCTILTTEPNELMQTFHHRMPVILQPEDYDLWIDPEMQTPESLLPLLKPHPASELIAFPVSKRVNNPSNDTLECIEPLDAFEDER